MSAGERPSKQDVWFGVCGSSELAAGRDSFGLAGLKCAHALMCAAAVGRDNVLCLAKQKPCCP
jgi:hypothetical protein